METPMVAVELKERTREYLYRLIELGAVEGPLGAMQPPPEIQKIVDAVHHVVAGGATEVAITEQGDPSVVAELNQRFHTVVLGGWR